MHCCCPLVCCSALVVFFFVVGGSVLLSLMCALNAHANDDETCSEGLAWLKWNVIASVLCGIAVLNRQKRIATNEKGESLLTIEHERRLAWELLEIMFGIFWVIWMIVGLVRLRGLDADCDEGVRDWMVVAVAGGFIVPTLLGCCWCVINFCAALVDEDS